ncbi:hypothetical protein EQV77_09225 [Halobacillus fulvus]|nr:hypothetical protein EQV77_09225 [Halobacillus fulvus]
MNLSAISNRFPHPFIMKELVRHANGGWRMNKELKEVLHWKTLVPIILFSVLVVLGYKYMMLPSNGHLYVPGDVALASAEVENIEKEANLYSVSVTMIPVQSRWDYFSNMRKYASSYYAFVPNEESKDGTLSYLEKSLAGSETELKKLTALEIYLTDTFGEEKAAELLDRYDLSLESTGGSDGLVTAALFKALGDGSKSIFSDKKVAVTGSLAEDGSVLPVGSTALKALAAEREGMDIFAVPSANYDEVFSVYEEGDLPFELIAVDHVEDVLEVLE